MQCAHLSFLRRWNACYARNDEGETAKKICTSGTIMSAPIYPDKVDFLER